MLSFFKKKGVAEKTEVKAFLTGKVIAIEEVPDEVFSTKALGDGIAIWPENEVLIAPADGEITLIMEESYHAVGMRLVNGMEVLLHIGLDTVSMGREGFHLMVKAGDKVKAGTELIRFSREAIAAKGLSDVTIMVVSNSDNYPEIKFITGMDAIAGETVVASFSA